MRLAACLMLPSADMAAHHYEDKERVSKDSEIDNYYPAAVAAEGGWMYLRKATPPRWEHSVEGNGRTPIGFQACHTCHVDSTVMAPQPPRRNRSEDSVDNQERIFFLSTICACHPILMYTGDLYKLG